MNFIMPIFLTIYILVKITLFFASDRFLYISIIFVIFAFFLISYLRKD